MRRLVSVVVVSLLIGLLTPMPGASGVGQSAPAGGGGSSAAALMSQLMVPGAGGNVEAVDPLTGVMGVTGTDFALDGRNGLGVSLTRIHRPGRWVGAAACDNGVDDDGDGDSDTADLECVSASDDSEDLDAPQYDTAGKPAQHLPDNTLWPQQLGEGTALLPAGAVYHHYRAHASSLNQADASADYLRFTTPGGQDVTLLADKVDAQVPDCVRNANCSSSDRPVMTTTAGYVSANSWKASVSTRYEGRGLGTAQARWTIHRDVDVQSPVGIRFTCQAGVEDAQAGYLGEDTFLPYFSTCSSIGDLFGNKVTVRYANVDDRGFALEQDAQPADGPKIDEIVDTYGRSIRCSYDDAGLLRGCYLDADRNRAASAGERSVAWDYKPHGDSVELTGVQNGRIRGNGSFEGLPAVWNYVYDDEVFGAGTKARVLRSVTDYRGATVAYGYKPTVVAKGAATGGTLTALVVVDKTVQGAFGQESFTSTTHWDYWCDGLTLVTTTTQPDGAQRSASFAVGGDGLTADDSSGTPTGAKVQLPDGGWNDFSFTPDGAESAALSTLTWSNDDGTSETVVRRRPPKAASTTRLEQRANRSVRVIESGFDDYGRPAQAVTQELNAIGAPIGMETTTKATYWHPGDGVWLVGNRASSTLTTYGSNSTGPTTSTEYDTFGRPIKLTENGLVQGTTTYDKSGPPAEVTDALGNRTTYTWGSYTGGENPTRTDVVRDALGGETSSTFDIEGRLVRAVDRLGRVTSVDYDEFGRVLKVSPPKGDTTHPGLPETVITYPDPTTVRATVAGHSSEARIDTAGRPRLSTSSSGVTEAIEYAANGAPAKTTATDTESNKVLSEQLFDSLGRPTVTRSMAGTSKLVQVASRSYDSAGRLASVVAPNASGSVKVTYAYDSLVGTSICTVDCAHSVVATSSYTPTGGAEVVASTSATLTQSVGGEDRIIGRSDDGGATWFTYSFTSSPNPASGTYDPFGQLRFVTGPNAISYSYTYDANARLTEQIRTDLSKTTYTYKSGPEGPTSIVDCTSSSAAGGERTDATTCFESDELNRPTKVIDKTGGTSVELVSYDYSGEDANLGQNPTTTTTSVRDNGVTYLYTRDVAGRVVQRSSNGAETGWRYDPYGRLARLYYPTGLNVRYGYDTKDRPNTISAYEGDTLKAQLVTTVAYNPNSTIAQVSYGNGTKANYGLDDYGMTTTMQAGKTNEILNRSFTYDAAARLTGIKSGTTLERQYYYSDTTGALTSETLAGTATKNSYALDTMGNRTTLTATSTTTGAITRTDTYNYSGMQLSSVSSNGATPATDTFSWPTGTSGRTGHLSATTKQTTPATTGTTSWDRRGRLTSFAKPTAEPGAPAGTYTYAYDDAGERRTKSRPDGTTHTYHRDLDGSALAESTSNGKTYEYIHGPGGRVARLDTADRTKPLYFLNNGQGSTLAAVDHTGALAQRIDTDAFGNLLNQTPDKLIDRHTFSTYELDPESHLYYAHARYYDPTAGRFLSQDPVTNLLTPWDHNPYTYAWANPVGIDDPDGRTERTQTQTNNDNTPTKTKDILTQGVEDFTGVPLEVYGANLLCVTNAATLGIPDLLDSGYSWLTNQHTAIDTAVARTDNTTWGSSGFCQTMDVVAGAVSFAHGIWNIAGSIGSGPTLTPALATSGSGGLTSTGTAAIDLARLGRGAATATLSAPMMSERDGEGGDNDVLELDAVRSPGVGRWSADWEQFNYTNVYNAKPPFGISMDINRSGDITFYIRKAPGTPDGPTMFADAFRRVQPYLLPTSRLYGRWGKDLPSNLNSFNRALLAGYSPQAAALDHTFTGSMAKAHLGMNRAVVVSHYPDVFPFEYVTVIFSRVP